MKEDKNIVAIDFEKSDADRKVRFDIDGKGIDVKKIDVDKQVLKPADDEDKIKHEENENEEGFDVGDKTDLTTSPLRRSTRIKRKPTLYTDKWLTYLSETVGSQWMKLN
eukprot:8271492-Ditylum_brightwellii.AAC.1